MYNICRLDCLAVASYQYKNESHKIKQIMSVPQVLDHQSHTSITFY